MKILIFVTAINIFSLFSMTAKDFDKKLERADVLYRGGNFNDALSMYLQLYHADSNNLNTCYKIGVCYLKAGNANKQTIYFLKKAVGSVTKNYDENSTKEKKAPVKAFKLLADAYHLNYEFDGAIFLYESYRDILLTEKNPDGDIIREIEHKISVCKNGKELMENPVDVKICNLGKNINSSYADYAPRFSADECTMIFTSKRKENTGGNTYDGGQFFEDIYIATRKNKNAEWPEAKNIGEPINTVGNEAAIAISADGQEILIYKDDLGDGNIYSSHLQGDKWTVPVKLNSNINSKFWEPAAFISADGNTIYFVSDRPGGYGGSDIYKSKRTMAGDWGKAVNLGPTINTSFDEHAPFIHPDGVTLYFSSKGHKTMGGYDVFTSRCSAPGDDGEWSNPVNVGYPINSPADDAFYTVSSDKQKAYYSSVKPEGYGDKDNYMVTFSDIKTSPLALVKGVVLNSKEQAVKNVIITVTDNETSEQVGVYHPNAKTGKYSLVLTPGKSYNISYEADGLLFYSENRYVAKETDYSESEKTVKLSQLAVGSKVELKNIFFDFDQTALRPYSKTELNNVFKFLAKYPKLSVEVGGYADSKGSDGYNKKLSLERAREVVSYLTKKGIRKERMVARGYGAVERENENKQVSEGERQLDRRVELKIIAVK